MFKVVCFNFLSSILVRISSNKCEIQQLKSNLSLYMCVFFYFKEVEISTAREEF